MALQPYTFTPCLTEAPCGCEFRKVVENLSYCLLVSALGSGWLEDSSFALCHSRCLAFSGQIRLCWQQLCVLMQTCSIQIAANHI